MANDYVLMVNDGNGGLRPAHNGEEQLAVSKWSLADVRAKFAPTQPTQATQTYIPGGYGDGGDCVAPGGYMDPGTRGPCAPRGSGTGYFGVHDNATGGTSETSAGASPQRPVRITALEAGGPNLSNWVMRTFRVNQDVIKHGGYVPMDIFGAAARYSVEFDMRLTPADTVTMGTSQLVSVSDQDLLVGATNCFNSARGLDSPCEPISTGGSRQIILGLGTGIEAAEITSGTGAAATASNLSDSPDSPIRLGRLCLAAVLNGTTVDASPRLGVTATNGMEYLSMIEVRQIDLNSVTIWTTVPTNGAIPATAFAAESGGVFFPDVDVDPSNTIRVGVVNRAAEATGTGTNNAHVVGAFVGCELIGC